MIIHENSYSHKNFSEYLKANSRLSQLNVLVYLPREVIDSGNNLIVIEENTRTSDGTPKFVNNDEILKEVEEKTIAGKVPKPQELKLINNTIQDSPLLNSKNNLIKNITLGKESNSEDLIQLYLEEKAQNKKLNIREEYSIASQYVKTDIPVKKKLPNQYLNYLENLPFQNMSVSQNIVGRLKNILLDKNDAKILQSKLIGSQNLFKYCERNISDEDSKKNQYIKQLSPGMNMFDRKKKWNSPI